jgi:hypothetical protein
MKKQPFTILVAVIAALALVAAACGGDDDDEGGTTTTDSSSTSTETTGTTQPTTTSTTEPTTGTSGPGTTGLPGEPWDGFAQPGDQLAVLGVAHDDVLNVRAIPGTDGEIVTTAEPTDDDLVATGQARQLSQSLWYEVTVNGVTGWVAVAFVAYQGPTDDATAEFLDGDDLPETETMEDMGELVAAGFASTDPASDIVQSVAPSVGDLGEVTYDVVGLGDDSGAGFRLHVFATPSESGEGFVLKSIERTTYCLRGLAGELCV